MSVLWKQALIPVQTRDQSKEKQEWGWGCHGKLLCRQENLQLGLCQLPKFPFPSGSSTANSKWVKLPAAIEGKRIQCNLSKAEAAHIASEQEEQEEKEENFSWIKDGSKDLKRRQLLNKQNIFCLTNYYIVDYSFKPAQHSPAAGFISCLYMYAHTHMVFSSHYADNLRKFGPKSWRLMHHSRWQISDDKGCFSLKLLAILLSVAGGAEVLMSHMWLFYI